MNRLDLQKLQSIRGYPALSILLPTHRTTPDNKQDPIRVRNLVKEATDRVLAEFSKREVAPLLTRLDNLVSQIDYRNTLDGLALFVNKDVAYVFYLPFALKERIVLDETFATRDLVYALNRSPRYWVLALSEKPTRLYEGLRDTLVEVTEYGFPMVHEGPGGTQPLPGGFGVRKSAYRDEHQRQFFRQVDDALAQVESTDTLPLVIVGVDRNISFFSEVTRHGNLIITTVTGNYDTAPPHELAKRVWPMVEANMAKNRAQALQELAAAVSARRYASGIDEAWRAVQEGRGLTLLVEEDFHFPAYLDADGLHPLPAEDATAPGVIDDAVDELIEMVLAQGGSVVFVENGALALHQRLALITRY